MKRLAALALVLFSACAVVPPQGVVYEQDTVLGIKALWQGYGLQLGLLRHEQITSSTGLVFGASTVISNTSWTCGTINRAVSVGK